MHKLVIFLLLALSLLSACTMTPVVPQNAVTQKDDWTYINDNVLISMGTSYESNIILLAASRHNETLTLGEHTLKFFIHQVI